MNCEAVGICLQAGAVLNAETSDFLFNQRDLKVLSEDHVRHIPWCVELWIGRVQESRYWSYKPIPRVVYRRPR
jgi:hypothetical protein